MIQAIIREKILENSIPLEDLGINDLSWTRANALDLISFLIDENIAILGGDVYKITEGKIISLYDNWYCNPTVDEHQ